MRAIARLVQGCTLTGLPIGSWVTYAQTIIVGTNKPTDIDWAWYELYNIYVKIL